MGNEQDKKTKKKKIKARFKGDLASSLADIFVGFWGINSFNCGKDKISTASNRCV